VRELGQETIRAKTEQLEGSVQLTDTLRTRPASAQELKSFAV